jgi:hypothetical protein
MFFVAGFPHNHPGYGVWLATQKSFPSGNVESSLPNTRSSRHFAAPQRV